MGKFFDLVTRTTCVCVCVWSPCPNFYNGGGGYKGKNSVELGAPKNDIVGVCLLYFLHTLQGPCAHETLEGSNRVLFTLSPFSLEPPESNRSNAGAVTPKA